MTIVGVGGRSSVDGMADFVVRHGLDHVDHLADVDGTVWALNGIAGQPAWVFVDGETGETEKAFGALGVKGLNAAIDALKIPRT